MKNGAMWKVKYYAAHRPGREDDMLISSYDIRSAIDQEKARSKKACEDEPRDFRRGYNAALKAMEKALEHLETEADIMHSGGLAGCLRAATNSEVKS